MNAKPGMYEGKCYCITNIKACKVSVCKYRSWNTSIPGEERVCPICIFIESKKKSVKMQVVLWLFFPPVG